MSEADSIAETARRAAAGIDSFRDNDRLLAALQAALGVVPPTTAGFVRAGNLTLSRLSPTRYFATGPRDGALAGRLADMLSGLAAVTDQSDMWSVFALSGPTVRELLAQIVPVDLRPEAFAVGDLALTRAGHVDVRLWRVGELNYEIATSRSFEQDLRHALGLHSR